MPDDKTIRHPHDGKRININQDYEVKKWCDIFDCTEQELVDAVEAVGDSAVAVGNYLGK